MTDSSHTSSEILSTTMMPSHERPQVRVKDYHEEPWLFRQFQKDRLRVRERYWEPLSNALARTQEVFQLLQNDEILIIPDGLVWRKYLRLITRLIEEKTPRLKFMLLESAVELMDWRNSSPCISVVDDDDDDDGSTCLIQEAAGVQERSRIQKLILSSSIIPFCDLTAREDEDDEFSLLGYSNMTTVDRSRFGLLRAARIFDQGKTSSDCRVFVLVDDSNLSRFQTNDGETARVVPVCDFLNILLECGVVSEANMSRLTDLQTKCENDYQRRNMRKTQSAESTMEGETLSEDDIQQGLAQGTLFRGRLDVTKENPKEAYVNIPEKGRYFVCKEHYCRALHHDRVVIRPLEESQWGRPLGRRRLVYQRSDDDEDDDMANEYLDIPPVPSAQVVATMTPSRRTYVATMTDKPLADEMNVLVVPMDIRIPKIRLTTRSWQNWFQQRLLVHVDDWEEGSNYPKGHVVKILGPVGDLEVEIASLLHENEVELDPFSPAALASLPAAGAEWKIPLDEIRRRRDLRESRRIFSVDPPGCQDIDDTMHAQVLPNGDIEVGVHIADVTYFVHHNSALDKEAQARATTFYLVDRRFDMLPSLLSSDLCSLHGKVDRLAVSVIWIMSPDLGTIKSSWFGRSVIRNCQAMTYDQAHNIIHGKAPDDLSLPPPPPLTAGAPVDINQVPSLKKDLTILTRLARKLRKDREEIGGAVDLSSGDLGSELKFVLDENGNPTKVSSKKELEIHHTIAELMILANAHVANKIYDSFPNSALLRVHAAVEENRFEDLEEALSAGGIAFNGSSNMALAQSLKEAEQPGKTGAVVNSLFRSLATRAMSEALYVCTGMQQELSHYGLGIGKYTHFTSPIRRYADVVVHKQLLMALSNDEMKQLPRFTPSPTVKKHLEILPDSNVISILSGEGLRESEQEEDEHNELEGDALLDSLIEGAAELVIGTTDDENSENKVLDALPTILTEKAVSQPYSSTEVSMICEVLNRHNRLAKLSSMECQRLFLSLYFRDHYEITEGVVTSLRVNGFWVYVPKFDLKGSIYVSDMEGNVQVNPALLGLAPDAGSPPSVGFAASLSARKFPHGKTTLIESPEGTVERLDVTVSERRATTLSIGMLDVVTVQVFCDSWDVRARVPPPRLHLLSKNLRPSQQPQHQQSTGTTKITSKLLQTSKQQQQSSHIQQSTTTTKQSLSVYEQVHSLKIVPVLSNVPLRCQAPSPLSRDKIVSRVESIRGRVTFGGFVNPDTRVATQQAAMAAASEAAAQRRANAVVHQGRQTESETSRSMERSAMARMQRLAADKRNTRKQKSN